MTPGKTKKAGGRQPAPRQPRNSDKLQLRRLGLSDYGQWRRAGERSQAEINARRAYPRNFSISRWAYARQCRHQARQSLAGRRYHFGIFRQGEFCGEVYADMNRRFPGSCSAGYWTDSQLTGQGIATTAMSQLIEFVFDQIKLGRIQLEIWPGHAASFRVARKLGFSHEGLARGLTFARGTWYDYEIYALTIVDWRRRGG